jgi:hypothetical protein
MERCRSFVLGPGIVADGVPIRQAALEVASATGRARSPVLIDERNPQAPITLLPHGVYPLSLPVPLGAPQDSE